MSNLLLLCNYLCLTDNQLKTINCLAKNESLIWIWKINLYNVTKLTLFMVLHYKHKCNF